jgi:hypothetical protein
MRPRYAGDAAPQENEIRPSGDEAPVERARHRCRDGRLCQQGLERSRGLRLSGRDAVSTVWQPDSVTMNRSGDGRGSAGGPAAPVFVLCTGERGPALPQLILVARPASGAVSPDPAGHAMKQVAALCVCVS